MTTTALPLSYTICQKSPTVESLGPCTHAHNPEIHCCEGELGHAADLAYMELVQMQTENVF